jgi:hypothetical protein
MIRLKSSLVITVSGTAMPVPVITALMLEARPFAQSSGAAVLHTPL